MDKEQLLEAALDAVAIREQAFEEACLAFADAESAYRIRRSSAYLEAEGTEKAREATAIVKVANLLEARNSAEAVLTFTKEKLRDAQTAVSARQSLLSADLRTNRAFA